MSGVLMLVAGVLLLCLAGVLLGLLLPLEVAND